MFTHFLRNIIIINVRKMSSSPKSYLLYFAQEHIHFRAAEISSLLSLFKIPMVFLEQPTEIQPFWIVEFKSEEHAKTLTSRSVSLHFCMELWGDAQDSRTLHSQMKLLPNSFYGTHLSADKTFRISVQHYGKHLTQGDKISKINEFTYLPAEAAVNLKEPETHLQYVEYYGTDSKVVLDKPYRVFFGRQVASGYRQFICKISLKTRKFIGNTSMDPQLSLLMANQARVECGDLVFDPFVGSGSLLVAAAQFGGYIVGSDIDYLMLHGKTRPSRINQKQREKDEGIKANMEQYGLKDKYLDVFISDFTKPLWRNDLAFDSIITDPPYGIREAQEKVGISKENYDISEEHLSTHIPAKEVYQFSQLYEDLLTFSAKHLKLGGRLVCWFPIFREDYSLEGLPRHSCLSLVANSEQVLSKYTARRLLTYEKLKEPSENGDETCNKVVDFRVKYFQARDETRQERRTKKAALKEQGRLRALEKLNSTK